MGELAKLPGASAILPFVLLSYGQQSAYTFQMGDGTTEMIVQAEGGEQGDPLMPAYFSLALHSALQRIQADLLQDE